MAVLLIPLFISCKHSNINNFIKGSSTIRVSNYQLPKSVSFSLDKLIFKYKFYIQCLAEGEENNQYYIGVSEFTFIKIYSVADVYSTFHECITILFVIPYT